MSYLSILQSLAEPHGLIIRDCGNGHLQITGGPLLVNYWPESKRRAAYVAGTREGIDRATPEQVIRLALNPPVVQSALVKRKSNTRKARIRLLRKRATCCWCGCPLSLLGDVPGTKKATLEHVIPLKRGGLDNPNNHDLACEDCNHTRGHDMPEIGTSK